MSETHEKPKTTKKEDVKDEVETFFPEGGEVFLPSLKKKMSVGKFKWGKQVRLSKLLSSALKDLDISKFSFLTEDNIRKDPQIVFNTFLPLLESAPEVITKITAIILDQKQEWVDEELDPEDILEVIVPFFVGAFKKYQSLGEKVSLKFQKR